MNDATEIRELLTEFETRLGVLMNKKITVIVHEPMLRNQQSFYKIASAVCDFYSISIVDILKKTRRQPIAEARSICCYLILKKTKATLKETADFFSFDHTSSIHARDLIEGRIKVNDEVTLAAIEHVNRKLHEA